MFQRRLFLSIVIVILCVVFRTQLERDPVTHVLVQLPLLIIAGWLLVPKWVDRAYHWNKGGITTLLVALTGILFWMLPRSIDAALASPMVEIVKFITLPLLVGVPLKLGWKVAHPLVIGFLKAQTISMLAVAAFIYIHAPQRLCNAYLIDAQERLGYGFLYAAFLVSICWIIPLFIPAVKIRQVNSGVLKT